jgi:hypothetical protein
MPKATDRIKYPIERRKRRLPESGTNPITGRTLIVSITDLLSEVAEGI